MILISLLLMQAAYAPETEAVMNRSRQRGEAHRAQEAQKVERSRPSALPLPPETAAVMAATKRTSVTAP